MSGLPTTWRWSTLDMLIQKIESGLSVKCEERSPRNGERGLVKISAVTWGRFNQEQSKTLPANAEVNETARISAGDLLISRANTIELVGASVIVGSIDKQLYLSDKVLRLVVPNGSKRWINYALKLPSVRKAIEESSSGNQLSMRNISQDKLRSIEIPLAPLPEQKRIADKLDTVLARVDVCRERLNRVPLILKRFRQSVFAAATSGQLSADWRIQGNRNWISERAGDVCEKVQSGGTPKEGFSKVPGVPFLKVYNIVNQQISFEYRPQYVSRSLHEGPLAKSKVKPGDVLMNIVGPPLGKVAVVPEKFSEWNINQAITLFRPSSRIISEWINIILCSGENIADIVNETKGSVGQINISLSQCRNFLFPVPPIEEQHEIVRRAQILLAFANRLEARLTAAQNAVDRLTPSLLAKAFRGELVPQDPNDEPAAELLKRLASNRLEAPKAPRVRKVA